MPTVTIESLVVLLFGKRQKKLKRSEKHRLKKQKKEGDNRQEHIPHEKRSRARA